MADLITQWLREKLGIIVDIHDESFLKMVLNGQLIALVLRHYNAITAEQFQSLETTSDSHQISNKVILWLKSLDPSLEEDAVNCFSKAKLSSTIKLFYKLHLILKGKDHLHFAAQRVIKQKLRTATTRFHCTKVSEEPDDPISVGPHPLSQPLQENYHIIQWHKDRYKALLQRCKEVRQAYVQAMEVKEKNRHKITFPAVIKELPKTDLPVLETFDTQSLCETYDELKEQEKRALEINIATSNRRLAARTVKRLKEKTRQEQNEYMIKSQMETIMLTKIWNETVRQQEELIELELSKKILTQSNYEKQMASKIFEIREQKHIMAENRNIVQKEIQRQMDEALLEYVFVKEKETGDERYRYFFERERTLELHQRICDEKQRLIKERKQNMCMDIVKDMVNFSLKLGEYREAFCEEMSPRMKKDLANLFINGKSIFDVVEDIQRVIDYVPTVDDEDELLVEEIDRQNTMDREHFKKYGIISHPSKAIDELLLEEIDRQNTMDKENFDSYSSVSYPYSPEKHVAEYLEKLEEFRLGMNILGHIVFRLLLTKYPKPPLPTPPDIPKVEVAVCITNIPDITILPVLEKLLSERKIRIIKVEEAVNYCLAAYKAEIDTGSSKKIPEPQFFDETEYALAEVRKKNECKNKKWKVISVAPKGQKPKGRRKGITNKNGETQVADEDNPPIQDKMVQTPSVFPCDEYKMSNEAELGKVAYEILNLGEALPDEILVKMIVEYLKTLKDIYGWVLINYPQNFEQAVLLEEALTAKKLPELLKNKCLEPQDIPNLEKRFTDNVTTTTLTTTHRKGDDTATTITTLTHDPHTPNKVRVCTENISREGVLTKCLSDIVLDSTRAESVQKLIDMYTFSGDYFEPIDSNVIKDEMDSEVLMDELEVKLEDLADLTFRDVGQKDINFDKNAEFRVSLLLSNPDVPTPVEEHDAYLTALIRLKQDVNSLESPCTDDIEEELLDVLTPLDILYQNQGRHYTLYYKAMDFIAIKHLGKLIVGEYDITPKSSVQIFGDSILYLEADVIQPDTANEMKTVKKGNKKKKEKLKINREKGDEGKKSKEDDKKEKRGKEKTKKNKIDKGSGAKKEKKGKIDGNADVMIERADKITQVPTPEPESVDEFVETPEPAPGTNEYIYVDLPIADNFQISLATVWENMEEVYMYDIRELMFRKRVLFTDIAPYMVFVRRYMKDYIERPDEKQLLVFNFQSIYNSLDADLRDDDEMKSELHCRIHELRENLTEICEKRMQEAEKERDEIILKDWFAKQTFELTGVYIMALQIELDRCVETMVLLNNYYTAMVTKMPCPPDGFEKVDLNAAHMAESKDFKECVTYKEFVRDMLKNTNFVLEDSPFIKSVRDAFDIALQYVELYNELSKKEIARIECALEPDKKAKSKKETKQGKNEKKFPITSYLEPEIREQGNKLIIEWTTASDGEKLRTLQRLNMIMVLATDNIRKMLKLGMERFHNISSEIKARYKRELKSVENCCAMFSRAVEEELPIQPQVVLRGDRFYIDPNILLFEDPLPGPEEPLEEYDQLETFTVDQLELFTATLLKVAPGGVIPEQAFLFLLQDMIIFVPEDGEQWLVPELWRKLSPKAMNKLCFEFFGNSAKIDWRDFILYNLCISFPTEEELMNARRQFRELDEDGKEFIYDYQYDSIKFWYEKEFDKTNPQDLNRFHKVRKILFFMYAINEKMVNYTKLLLGFCKGNTTVEGVAKALALSLGKLVCHQREIGEAFVETLRERKRKQVEEELEYQLKEKEKLDTARYIMDSLVDNTVNEYDSYLMYCVDNAIRAENCEPPVPLVENPHTSESTEYLEQLMKKYGPDDMYENEYCSDFYHEESSNIESDSYKNPPLVYYLLFETVFSVLMTAMPWHAIAQNIGEKTFRQNLEKIYNELKNHEFGDMVLMHEFLNSVQFTKRMAATKKFVIVNPKNVIKSLIAENIRL